MHKYWADIIFLLGAPIIGDVYGMVLSHFYIIITWRCYFADSVQVQRMILLTSLRRHQRTSLRCISSRLYRSIRLYHCHRDKFSSDAYVSMIFHCIDWCICWMLLALFVLLAKKICILKWCNISNVNNNLLKFRGNKFPFETFNKNRGVKATFSNVKYIPVMLWSETIHFTCYLYTFSLTSFAHFKSCCQWNLRYNIVFIFSLLPFQMSL